jgi:hypothetical protein
VNRFVALSTAPASAGAWVSPTAKTLGFRARRCRSASAAESNSLRRSGAPAAPAAPVAVAGAEGTVEPVEPVGPAEGAVEAVETAGCGDREQAAASSAGTRERM